MSIPTQFSIDDAEDFSRQLIDFSDILNQEYNRLVNQWNNLQGTWHDTQYSDFIGRFWDNFETEYKNIIRQYEENQYFLNNKIQIAEKSKTLPRSYRSINNTLIQNTNTVFISQSYAPVAFDESLITPENFSKSLGNSFLVFKKSTAATIAFTSIFFGYFAKIQETYISDVTDIFDRVILSNAALLQHPIVGSIQEEIDQVKEKHGLDSQVEELSTVLELDREKKKKEYERRSHNSQEPKLF